MESYLSQASVHSFRPMNCDQQYAVRVRIAVVGSSGFIGSELIRPLLEHGYSIVAVDVRVPESKLAGVTYLACDALDSEALSAALVGVNAVIYCAGASDLESNAHEATITAHQNVVGIAITLEACVHAEVGQIVYLSSVYAGGLVGGFYSASKRAAEDYLRVASERFGLTVKIVRVGSVYGPSSSSRSLVNRVVRAATKDRRIVLNGTPSQKRSYIHVRDVAQGLLAIVENDNYANQTLRLVGEEAIELGELCEITLEATGTDHYEILPERPGSPHYIRTPDRSAAVARTVSLPQFIDLQAGISELLTFYGGHHDGL